MLNYIKPSEVVNNESVKKIEEKPVEVKQKEISEEVIVVEEQNDSNEFLDDYNEECSEYLSELKSIRLNNCFATAQKSILTTYQQKFQNQDVKNLGNIQSLLVDTKIVAAGKQIAILAASLDSTADLINHHLEQIEQILASVLEDEVKLIAVSDNDWLNLKQEYVQNLKNGVKYEVIDELGVQELKPTLDNSQLEQFAEQMFENKKIEIV